MSSRRRSGRCMSGNMTNNLKLLFVVPLVSLLVACGSAVTDVSDEGGENVIEVTSAVMKLPSETREEIKNVLYEKYLGGQKNSSVETLRNAFHPDSVMLFPSKDEAGKSYLQKWTDMHSTVVGWAEPGNPDLNFDNFEILSMNVVDERMAVVIFKIEDRVYDAITLINIDDTWKIASKVYILQ